ncbi:9714_t:CDS:1 [Funneliformis caledonium]|uniref:9714_t:CDS:1 n=1 Tax=Funneliformis caledonium TaxID=1117310 RepID=A0A9N9D935_9GLOM|nr:9714_t:CDS:1 [Funneliformis caledonium]
MKSDLSNISALSSMTNHQQGSEFQFIMENKLPGSNKASVTHKTRAVPAIPADFIVPYPPKITAKDIVEKAKLRNNSSKSPNKFLIYRKAFVTELLNQGFNYSMTDISKFIGERWRKEPKHVKDTYQEISCQANRLHKESFGHSIVKKKNRKKALNKSPPIPAVNMEFSSLMLPVPGNFSCDDNINYSQIYSSQLHQPSYISYNPSEFFNFSADCFF